MPSRPTSIVFGVSDLPASTALFRTLLGTDPITEQPYYVGFRVDDQEIGLDPYGHQDTGPVCYWEVDDLEEARARLLDGGATEQQPARDVGGGKLVALFRDPSGITVGLSTSPG